MMNNFKMEKSLAVGLLSVTTLFGVGCKKQKPAQVQIATGLQKDVVDSQNQALVTAQLLTQHIAEVSQYLNDGTVTPYIYSTMYDEGQKFAYDLYIAPRNSYEHHYAKGNPQGAQFYLMFTEKKMIQDDKNNWYHFEKIKGTNNMMMLQAESKPGKYYLGKVLADAREDYSFHLGMELMAEFNSPPHLMITHSSSEGGENQMPLPNLFIAKHEDIWKIFKYDAKSDNIVVIKQISAKDFPDEPKIMLVGGHVFIIDYSFFKGSMNINNQADKYGDDVSKYIYLTTAHEDNFRGSYKIDLKADPAASQAWQIKGMLDGLIFTKDMDHNTSWKVWGPVLGAVIAVAIATIITAGAFGAFAPAAIAPEVAAAATTTISSAVTKAVIFGAAMGLSGAVTGGGGAAIANHDVSLTSGHWQLDKIKVYEDYHASGYYGLTPGQKYIRIPHAGSQGDMFISINDDYKFDDETKISANLPYFKFKSDPGYTPHWSTIDENGNYNPDQEIEWGSHIWEGLGVRKAKY
jgi:hypothetical protein